MRDNGGEGAQASSPSVCCPSSAASLRYSLGVMPVMVLNMREKYPGESNPHIVSISPIERDVSRRSLLATIILRWRMKRVVDMPVMFLMRRLSCERLVGTISASCWLLMVAQLMFVSMRWVMRSSYSLSAAVSCAISTGVAPSDAWAVRLRRILSLWSMSFSTLSSSSREMKGLAR